MLPELLLLLSSLFFSFYIMNFRDFSHLDFQTDMSMSPPFRSGVSLSDDGWMDVCCGWWL